LVVRFVAAWENTELTAVASVPIPAIANKAINNEQPVFHQILALFLLPKPPHKTLH